MILLVACTDNKLQRAEREQFGRKDADQEPAGGSGFVVFFHVAQVTVGADMAAAGESAAFDFDGPEQQSRNAIPVSGGNGIPPPRRSPYVS